MSFSSNRFLPVLGKLLILFLTGVALTGCVSTSEEEGGGWNRKLGSSGDTPLISDREWK